MQPVYLIWTPTSNMAQICNLSHLTSEGWELEAFLCQNALPLAKSYIWLLVRAADVIWASFPCSDLLKDSKNRFREDTGNSWSTSHLFKNKFCFLQLFFFFYQFFPPQHVRHFIPLLVFFSYRKSQGVQESSSLTCLLEVPVGDLKCVKWHPKLRVQYFNVMLLSCERPCCLHRSRKLRV